MPLLLLLDLCCGAPAQERSCCKVSCLTFIDLLAMPAVRAMVQPSTSRRQSYWGRLYMHSQGERGDACVCRPDFVIDSTFDLFCELCATDEQCDFPVVYASGVNGIAGGSPETLAEDLAPLFEAIVKEVRAPALPRAVLLLPKKLCAHLCCSAAQATLSQEA